MFKLRHLLTSLVVLSQISLSVQAQTFKAVVVSIGDGDTIRVKQNTKALTVRLACIDAPEMSQNLPNWYALAKCCSIDQYKYPIDTLNGLHRYHTEHKLRLCLG